MGPQLGESCNKTDLISPVCDGCPSGSRYLRSSAPMCPFAQPCFNGIDLLHQLLDHGQYWVANQFGLLAEFIPIDFLNPAMLYDFVGGFLRNDLKTGLCDSKSGLEVEIVFSASGVGPDGGALGCGQNVAEDEGVGNRCHFGGKVIGLE
jgi:hypothetical protein